MMCRKAGLTPKARGIVCAAKCADVIGERISGQHQGQRILFSAKEGRRHDRTHDPRNAEK